MMTPDAREAVPRNFVLALIFIKGRGEGGRERTRGDLAGVAAAAATATERGRGGDRDADTNAARGEREIWRRVILKYIWETVAFTGGSGGGE